VTDNIFDRLRKLLESSGPVNWGLAREIAESVAGDPEPVDPWIAEELEELTHTAALRIGGETPLDPSAHSGDVRAVDRRAWASANVEGFAYLAEPLADRMSGTAGGDPLLGQLAPALLGMQMGSMVGAMSHRVLGQFDVGLPPAGSALYFVVPNIEGFAADHDLEERQTRLWLAMHEVVHRAEFSVPWVREHFDQLVAEFVDGLELDPGSLQERMGGLEDPEQLQRMLEDPSGLTGLLATPEQQPVLCDIRAFMALTEGYGDFVIERSSAGMLPEAERLREAIDRRRAEPSQGEQMMQRILGLELEHHRYRRGTTFCNEVARRWGDDALARIWNGPEMLPTEDELDDVVGWAARVLL
jgi:putative hydrolase